MTTQTELVSATPVLASRDIERSVAFFCSRLGFSKVHVEGTVYAIVSRGPVHIHFTVCPDPHVPENTGCRIRVLGIDKLYAALATHGIVHPAAPLERKPWGTAEFGVADPDGNLITFAEWLDADG